MTMNPTPSGPGPEEALPAPGTAQGGREPDTEQAERRAREAGRSARESAQRAKQAGQQLADSAGETLQQASDKAKAISHQAAGKAKDAAAQLTGQMRDKGSSMLRDQKDRAADQLDDIGAAMRRAGETLHQEHDDNLASYADAMAERADRCARYLREHDVNQLVHETADLARRRPEWVLGGAFVAGLAIARFLKASRSDGGGAAYGSYRRPMRGRTPGRDDAELSATPDSVVAVRDTPDTTMPGDLSMPTARTNVSAAPGRGAQAQVGSPPDLNPHLDPTTSHPRPPARPTSAVPQASRIRRCANGYP